VSNGVSVEDQHPKWVSLTTRNLTSFNRRARKLSSQVQRSPQGLVDIASVLGVRSCRALSSLLCANYSKLLFFFAQNGGRVLIFPEGRIWEEACEVRTHPSFAPLLPLLLITGAGLMRFISNVLLRCGHRKDASSQVTSAARLRVWVILIFV
jgi:hypothetical protein